MDDWQPATIEDVNQIVARDLKDCDSEQLAAFDKYRVTPFPAPIVRYGQMESVVVVARNGDHVIYYEDVEDGFNVSPTSPDKFLSIGAIKTNSGSHSMRGSRIGASPDDLGLQFRSMSELAFLTTVGRRAGRREPI